MRSPIAKSRVKKCVVAKPYHVTVHPIGVLMPGTVLTPDHRAWDNLSESLGFTDDEDQLCRNIPFLVKDKELTEAEKKELKQKEDKKSK